MSLDIFFWGLCVEATNSWREDFAEKDRAFSFFYPHLRKFEYVNINFFPA